jgi:prenylcysteine alpha-carboxyl methylesterase
LKFWRLVIYAMLLLPGFIQVIAFYFLSPRVIRNVAYGRGVSAETAPAAAPTAGVPSYLYLVAYSHETS